MATQFDMKNDDVMWIEVNLKTSFYQPEKLEKGMWFMNSLYPGTDREYVELWELEVDVPDDGYDEFVSLCGYPVQLLFTMEMQNPDEPDDIIVFSENIGWVYDTENETMDVIDLKFVNNVIANYGGKVFLLIDEFLYDDDGEVVPEMENDLVIATYPFEEESDDEEYHEDDYEWYDDDIVD